MQKAFKYRLYPSREQTTKLERTLDLCRQLYNTALEQRRMVYQTQKKALSCYDQQSELPYLKKQFPEFEEVYSQVLQDVLKRLDRAFDSFFRRVKEQNGRAGCPRFKGKNRYHSFTYPQSGFSLGENTLFLSKIGDIKIRLHRHIEGKIKRCTIKREIDQWFAIFTCELPDPEPVAPQTAIGVDVGVESFLTTSDGEQVKNPRHLQQSQKKLRRLQRALARKKKSGKNRQKAGVRVAKLHRKIKRQRLDFHHKVARQLVNRYDLIAVEDLSVAGMVKNDRLAKFIYDAAWSGFVNILACKAAEAGKSVVRVPARHTSQVCSRCGSLVSKELSQRWHECDCGLRIHRDHNAALNILRLGRSLQASSVPLARLPEKPTN